MLSCEGLFCVWVAIYDRGRKIGRGDRKECRIMMRDDTKNGIGKDFEAPTA
jgi:hypothetical protein